MATLDLTNDITPLHPYRPDKISLGELRRQIRATVPSVYTQAFLDNCNRNDLMNIARTHGVRLPAPGKPALWAATTAYKVGDQVLVTGPGLLEATVAGTSAGTAPANPGSVGGTVTDGGVTWKRVT